MADSIPHDREFRPTLTARTDDRYPWFSIPAVATTSPLSRRGLLQHFTRKGRRVMVRPAAEVDHSRRVAVRVRPVPHLSAPRTGLMAHIRYIERDGAGPAGEPVELFGPQQDQADGHAFAYRAQQDRHHFRITIAPEDGAELGDLRAFGRELMSRVEKDLGTRLEWVAGAHHDTGRPHLHLIIRGVRDDGRTLRVERDYITSGFRERAQAIATEALGSRPLRSQAHRLKLDRFTELDRFLIEHATEGKISAKDLPDLVRSDALQRLGHLEVRGWVERDAPGRWRIPQGLRRSLSSAQEQGARLSAATKILAEGSRFASVAELTGVEPEVGQRLTGSFVGCRFIGPYAGGVHIVVVEFEDGRLGHLRMPDTQSVLCLDKVPRGAIVELVGAAREPRASDRTVSEVASRNHGVWSPVAHRSTAPSDSLAFVDRHMKRVSSLAREGACDWLDGEQFAIPEDFTQKALAVDCHRWGPATATLKVLDDRPLSEQVFAEGQTWLDLQLALPRRQVASGRFGGDVEAATAARAEHLRAQGLGQGDPYHLTADDLQALGLKEVERVFAAYNAEGKSVFLVNDGDPVRGVYTHRVHTLGTVHAAIESEAAVTLVPWKPGLEACRGQLIAGAMTDRGLEFRTVRAMSRGFGLEL